MFGYILLFVAVNFLGPVVNVRAAVITGPEIRSPETDAAEFCAELFHDARFAECQSQTTLGSVLEDACSWNYLNCAGDPTVCACDIAGQFASYCVTLGITSLVKWRDVDFCPYQCTDGRVFNNCAPSEDRTCEMQDFDDGACLDSCYCPAGYVARNGTCIEVERCPCMLDGEEIEGGTTISQGSCNTCYCNKGTWDCTNFPCSTTCHCNGDPHYTSFDGTYFDFMGNCSYHLATSDDFDIIGENGAWFGGSYVPYAPGLPTCTKRIIIITMGYEIIMDQGMVVTVNGIVITNFPTIVSGIQIYKPSTNRVAVLLPSGVNVIYNGAWISSITVPRSYRNKLKGLCGNYNDLATDDFMKPDGQVTTSINEFGNSWSTDENCYNDEETTDYCEQYSDNKEAAQAGCGNILSSIFAECQQLIDPQIYYNNCVFDSCSCINNLWVCVCPMIQAYADDCRSRGIIIDWRSGVEECAMECSGGQTYEVCPGDCQPTCLDISANVTCYDNCVEDCRCPTGQVVDVNGICIDIEDCSCPLNGKNYPSGQQVIINNQICACEDALWSCTRYCNVEDETYYVDCNSCQCTFGEWNCTDIICPTDGCIVRESNGTHPQIFITVGEVYRDGPCTNCTCELDGTTYNLSCETEQCANETLDTVNFVYEDISTEDECCPDYIRVACLGDGQEYTEGQSWNLDLCTVVLCSRNASGTLIKRQYVTNCDKTCNEGYEYVESTTACCGQCVQYACIVDDGIKLVGESWESADGCTLHTCAVVNGQFVIFNDSLCRRSIL